MAQTYAEADKVLVIDDWLMQTGFYSHPSVDLLKLKSCARTERLRTLHERKLTRDDQLHFQTREGPIAEGEIFETINMLQKGPQTHEQLDWK